MEDLQKSMQQSLADLSTDPKNKNVDESIQKLKGDMNAMSAIEAKLKENITKVFRTRVLSHTLCRNS